MSDQTTLLLRKLRAPTGLLAPGPVFVVSVSRLQSSRTLLLTMFTTSLMIRLSFPPKTFVTRRVRLTTRVGAYGLNLLSTNRTWKLFVTLPTILVQRALYRSQMPSSRFNVGTVRFVMASRPLVLRRLNSE